MKSGDLLAIIPARGGSKRIPRKNIKSFSGKPIISYSINAALRSGLFSEVMVSTDDKEISDIAIQYGASVPFKRSSRASSDYATTSEVLVEVLKNYGTKYNSQFKTVCCIYPTAPFITSELLCNSYAEFRSKNADSLLPIVKYSYPPQRSFIIKKGLLQFRELGHENDRSQDLDDVFHDAGQFYWLRASKMIEANSLIFGNTYPYEINEISAQDIDNISDWKMAELKYSMLQHK
jgi:pseudaminic acid cytidylyltransferase